MVLASFSAFSIAYQQSDPFGKLVILGLVALSGLCWVILLYKVWVLRKVKNLSTSFQRAFFAAEQSLLGLELTALPRSSNPAVPNPYGAIFWAVKQKASDVLNKNHYFLSKTGGGVYLTSADIDFLRDQGSVAISQQIKELEKHIFLLSTIVTLAPFMGLLGTVWGILVSFSGLHAGASAGSNAAILGGLSTALATTVLGLLIAIPALIGYNYLKNALRGYSSDMDDFLSHLLATVELEYRRVE